MVITIIGTQKVCPAHRKAVSHLALKHSTNQTESQGSVPFVKENNNCCRIYFTAGVFVEQQLQQYSFHIKHIVQGWPN